MLHGKIMVEGLGMCDQFQAHQIALSRACDALVELVERIDNDMILKGDFPGVPSGICRAKLAIQALTDSGHEWPTRIEAVRKHIRR